MRGIKKWYYGLVLVLILIIVPTVFFLIGTEEIEEDNDMSTLTSYNDLGIISAKKPWFENYLIETNSSGILYLLDSIDRSKIQKTIDKGDNWAEVVGHTGWIIRAFWHDRTNSKLYFSETDEGGGEWRAFYLDLSDDSVVQVGITVAPGDATFTDPNSDIFLYDGNIYVNLIYSDTIAPTYIMRMYKSNGGNFALQDSIVPNDVFMGPVTIVGTDAFFLEGFNDEPLTLRTYDLGGDAYDVAYEVEATGYNVLLTGIAYDGVDTLFFAAHQNADANDYLYTYSIIGGTATQHGKYNVSLMLDRNTATGVLEKAFHRTEYRIYQIQENNVQLNLIAEPVSDAVFWAITDNFLMNDDKDMFELRDVLDYSTKCEIDYANMDAPSALLTIDRVGYPITKGMFITFRGMFTTAGVSTADSILFEGFVNEFSDRRMSEVVLTSPSNRDLHSEFPSGDYSGRTDEIIVDLITEYADYITIGTLSAGTAMGTITFGGEKSVKEILDEFCLIDGFIWYLTPTGVFYYNDGTVDSGENFTAASPIHNVNRVFAERAINRVDVKGAFVAGVQVSGTIAEDVPAQQLVGINPYEDVHSHLNTNALCTTVNTAVLARYGVQPLVVPFSHRDATVGMIQPGETVTFEYNITDPNVASDQFGIRGVIYDVLLGVARYRISDVII